MDDRIYISHEHDEALDLLSGKAVKLYIHLVFRASTRDTQMVKKGCLFDSLEGISGRSGLSIQAVRTALKKLEKAGLIVKNQHDPWQGKRRTNIEIKGYVSEADINTIPNKLLTNDQQVVNKLSTRLDVSEEEKKKEKDVVEKEKRKEEASPASANPKGLTLGPTSPPTATSRPTAYTPAPADLTDPVIQKQIQAQDPRAQLRARLALVPPLAPGARRPPCPPGCTCEICFSRVVKEWEF